MDRFAYNFADETIVEYTEVKRGFAWMAGSGPLKWFSAPQICPKQYPSLKAEELLEGDLHFNFDFRGAYSTVVER